jgi:gluconokinase
VQTPLILSLDLGTSSVRAVLFDARGQRVGAIAQHEYSQHTTPDSGVEFPAEELFQLVVACIDDVLHSNARLLQNASVAAIATSCFWHSLLAINANAEAQTPVLSWADNRAAAHVLQWRDLVNADEVHARTGCVPHTSYWPAKLLWLRDVAPALFHASTRFVGFGEYLELKLCGEARSSLCMASGTGLFHQNNADWDESILDVLQLSQSNPLPLCDAHDALNLLSEWKMRWPQLSEAKWFPPLGDGACSNIGSGCADNSRIALNIGTSAALRVVLHNFEGNAPQGLWRYRLDKNRSLLGGAISNAGNVWAWASKTFQLPDEKEIAAIAPNSHGLTVLPFLAGERSPLWNPDARFALIGASLDTTSAQILRASLESVALRLLDVTHRVRSACNVSTHHLPIVASGGALQKSETWRQIVCDALGAPIILSDESEASARGAALIALEGLGVLDDAKNAPRHESLTVQSNSEHHAIYVQALERQMQFYDAIKNCDNY